jgi:PAS domain S-box-containing protein
VDNAPLGIFQLSLEGRLLGANPALAAMLGFPLATDMLAHQPQITNSFVFPEDRARWISQLATGHEITGMHAAWSHRDGSILWVRLHVKPAVDGTGRCLHFDGMVEDITETMKKEGQIRQLNRELLRIQDLERARIAMDLHDDVAQNLLAAKLEIARLASRPSAAGDPDLASSLNRLDSMIAGSLSSIRDLSSTLRPPDLDRLGLAGALGAFCRDMAERTGITVEFQAVGLQSFSLDYETQTHCFRLLQEAVQNAARHSGARRITVSLTASHPKLIARIEDDGNGFDVAARTVAGLQEKRMGLRGMHERAAILGGQLRVLSRPGHGTSVTMETPLRNEVHGNPQTRAQGE